MIDLREKPEKPEVRRQWDEKAPMGFWLVLILGELEIALSFDQAEAIKDYMHGLGY